MAEEKSAVKLGVQYDFSWTGRENRRFASVGLKAGFRFVKKTSIVLVRQSGPPSRRGKLVAPRRGILLKC